ncbi:methylamine dehydrogenase accessory protein MauD [Paraburkholderia saeva]|jgi:methylamine dehydrogenase accessory protein MauD|uniref:Methylamine utilization protein MauD n=1 Tax=Paraburkholderia saeva TaxID=2777537 RepID=A0A9N8RZB0_9BURK|nr:methylamine dehydrogenase accessory protein MauD [Paraburkholderia saeva]CAG4904252.1 Methylamine utilization protein MauD [Paraburkholderia saeva]CAG4906109.1 Methylamine utilization protein MauD [Paraburkholderia saeva]CAG4910067.1 Methylamine utilization protein MauD [Paraburkholderia saeva]
MENALLISTALLWIAVLALGAISLALVRQVGILYERLMPVGALMIDKGPAVGTVGPAFELGALDGRQVKVGGVSPKGRSTLVFFLSPTCPVCKKLLPLLPSIQSRETATDIVLASDGDTTEHAAFYKKTGLQQFPYVLSQELGLAYQIGKLPYALLLDETGKVRAKGLVNSREHLESLFEAKERGVASLQEFVHGEHHDHGEQHA